MTLTLQILLILFCLGLLVVIVSQISRSRVIFSDFNYWIIFVLILLFMAIFPKTVDYFAQLIGVQSPIFAVFLGVIFLLILLVLSSAFRISALNRRSIQLVQKIALIEEEFREQIEAFEEKMEKEVKKNK